MRPSREICRDMLHDESGTASVNWISLGMAALLLLAMITLEGLVYRCTGGGFLAP